MDFQDKGFVPVMLTPFHCDGSIDFEALTKLTEYYIQCGAKGLFANCQSSEMFELSPTERFEIVEHVVQSANGRVPVVAAGNFGNSIRDQAIFVSKIYSLGVKAVILLTNQLVGKHDPEALLERNILELLSLTGNIPVGFYECPVPYKVILAPQLLARLVATGRVIYHKDTSLDIRNVSEKNRLCTGYRNFGLYDAYMGHAVESLNSGSAGLSCIQGNYFPELVVWLCYNYNNDSMKAEVEQVQQFFRDEMDVMHDYYPRSAKYYMQKSGLPITTYTRKLGNDFLDGEVKELLDNLELRYYNLLEQCQLPLASGKFSVMSTPI